MTKLILFPRAKLLLVIILLFFISSGYAQEKEKRIIHPVMGTLSLSLESGITIPFTDYKNSEVGFAYRGSVGYYFNTYTNHFVGIKAFGGLGQIKGSDPNRTSPEFKTDIAFVGAGINYGYRISEKVFPSVFAGLSYLHFKPKDKNNQPLPNNLANVYSKDDVNLNFDLGLQYLITDQVTIGLSGGVAINFNDWLDDTERGNENDIFYNVMAGINYYVFGKKDSDKDGVDDDKDACPDTPEGVDVDENGCPIDTDRDGVPDYLDACSHTPAGVQVDSEGCPIDSDGDGILDKNNQDLRYSIKVNSDSRQHQDIAVMVQAQLKKVGVEIVINRLDWNTFIDQVILLEQALRARDRAGARPLWREFQQTIIDDCPYTFLFIPDDIVAGSTRLTNAEFDIRGFLANVQSWQIVE